ncbi:MAG: polymerase LigD, ligase domain protein [Phycisphaerales bacterium]|nr:polymerase LigD, ligase domain protein [Phycisphaerales bacterium]
MPARSKLLPAFVEPMLATLASPFESDRHLYELKWDGFRSLVVNGGDGCRLVGRRKTDFTARFPELDVLGRLPKGTILDGEIVHLTNGRPDFAALLKRERSWSGSAKQKPDVRRLSPVTFVAFDLLYESGRSIMDRPLIDRRERLAQVTAKLIGPRVALSEARTGDGLALFKHVADLGLEGVVAKRLDGIYEPGSRSGSWVKFKRRQEVVCAIIGYEPNTTGGLKSLLLATDVDGDVRFIGKVGSGIGDAANRELLAKFPGISSRQPVVPCKMPHARWLRPVLFCRVSFAEWTNDRRLRQPVFEAMV